MNCKIHVLWNISGKLCNPQGVELGNDNPNHVSARIEDWTTTVARLNRRTDLHKPNIVL